MTIRTTTMTTTTTRRRSSNTYSMLLLLWLYYSYYCYDLFWCPLHKMTITTSHQKSRERYYWNSFTLPKRGDGHWDGWCHGWNYLGIVSFWETSIHGCWLSTSRLGVVVQEGRTTTDPQDSCCNRWLSWRIVAHSTHILSTQPISRERYICCGEESVWSHRVRPGFPLRYRKDGRLPAPPSDPNDFRRYMELASALQKQKKREELERYQEQKQRYQEHQTGSGTNIPVQSAFRHNFPNSIGHSGLA